MSRFSVKLSYLFQLEGGQPFLFLCLGQDFFGKNNKKYLIAQNNTLYFVLKTNKQKNIDPTPLQ